MKKKKKKFQRISNSSIFINNSNKLLELTYLGSINMTVLLFTTTVNRYHLYFLEDICNFLLLLLLFQTRS